MLWFFVVSLINLPINFAGNELSHKSFASPESSGHFFGFNQQAIRYGDAQSNAVLEFFSAINHTYVYGINYVEKFCKFSRWKKYLFFVSYTPKRNKNHSIEKKNLHLIDVINLVGFAHSFNPSTVLTIAIYLTLQRK